MAIAKLANIHFQMMSPSMIREIATVEIARPELYDRDGYPVENGVMDTRMGVIDPGMRCNICGGRVGACLGHFGYMELARPLVHVKHIKTIYQLLRGTCQSCAKPLDIPENLKKKSNPLYYLYLAKKKKCPHCNHAQEEVKLNKPYNFVVGSKQLLPVKIREWFENISDEDVKLLGMHGGRPEWMIITLMPVPPNTVRPSITLETGERSEDDLTHKLVDIVRINQRLRDNITIGAPDFIIDDLQELLQYHVSTFFDNDLSGVPQARHRSGRALRTLTQRLRGKEGRFRSNLTGKRVNFSGRTVISPDPKLSINEVGVPEMMVKELTSPVRVNALNLVNLRATVRRGAEELDGANYVIRPDGRKKRITSENKDEIAEELAEGYIVERHLRDGDTVIFNRQPSLHRMSVMAHKVRVMPGRTFRLNLCVTRPYNADFDGDEMNLHVPQNEEAIAEAQMLMMVQDHIRSPRFGGPIMGCIQDHISGNYMLTLGNTKISKNEANQILANLGMDERTYKDITGKELFSFLLPKDLSMTYKSNAWSEGRDDLVVKIKNGQLVSGVIDSKSIGAEKGVLIDKIDKMYGSEVAKDFLDRVSNIGIEWLTRKGFTIGMSDQDISSSAKGSITKIINEAEAEVGDIIKEYKKGGLEQFPGQTVEESLETHIQIALGQALEKSSRVISDDMSEDNKAIIMARSGARGNIVNLTQLAGMVGQQTIQGERIHRGYRQRTLPHFKKGDLTATSHGFVSSSYRTGLDPFEFFFNAMNGREGLMDKSLRTRHSGYMERRLVNALQDLKIEYDGTVRGDTNNIVQFIAAEDMIDPAKSQWGSVDVEGIVDSVIEE